MSGVTTQNAPTDRQNTIRRSLLSLKIRGNQQQLSPAIGMLIIFYLLILTILRPLMNRQLEQTGRTHKVTVHERDRIIIRHPPPRDGYCSGRY